MEPRILVVAPEPSSALVDALRGSTFVLERAASTADAVSRIARGDAPDVIVLPEAGPDERAAARQIRQAQPRISLVFVVDPGRVADARHALQFEPSIGHDTEVVASGDRLATELEAIATAACERARHREVIDRINASLLAPRERPPPPDGTLLERYERLVLAVEAAEMGTWDLDPTTGAIRSDDRARAIFGLAPDAALDLAGFLALLHDDDRMRVDALLRAALAPGGPELATEYRAIVADAEVWIAARARAFDTDLGRRLIGSVQDVTARKRVEDERASLLRRAHEARREAEEANRIKDEFLATVSHELRTPLSAVLGWARMLRSRALPEDRREHALETIERNARVQAQLIDDLLDVSRILAGKLRLDVRPIDVGAVVEAALEVVRPAADAKGVRLHPVLDPSASPIVGDAGRVQQIVWNLLANAVKFTPRGGRVQIRLERVESSIEIVISDSGEGIREELLPHVFERFRQADGSASRKHGGLGLGLSIVKHLTELHGGSVRALSEGPGRGATFVVRLPLASATTATPERARSHPKVEELAPFECPPELAGVRVLVVDDEPDARDLLATVLSSCGARVDVAASAREALAQIAKEPPDVLVSDIGMPDETGYDLIRKVRALPASAGGRTPAVAITAYARVEDRTRALRAGFQLHAAKPIEPAELLAVVANLAGRIQTQK